MTQAIPQTAPHWTPSLTGSGAPLYIEIAEAIQADMQSGALRPGDRLPPQRALAQALGVDFSTISRAYAEATRRGYTESFVGRGTFVASQPAAPIQPPLRQIEDDPRMNMPPEPSDPDLLARMQAGYTALAPQLPALLRYQSTTGLTQDREIAATWLAQNALPADPTRLAIAPGSHAAIHAILSLLADPGLTLLCEDLTYPGIRAIAAQLGLTLVGLPSDDQGILPDALSEHITKHRPVALYLNPTLQNPTTRTMPAARRKAIAATLHVHDLPLLEDDAYAFTATDTPAPISSLIPGLSWHIIGLSKLLGAGLRLAYVTPPSRAHLPELAAALRAQHVMASPLTLALAHRWISDGTATALQSFLRREAAARHSLAAQCLPDIDITADPNAYNLWLTLPKGISRAEILSRLPQLQMGLMPSDAFCSHGPAPEALRVCLGGPITRADLQTDLLALHDAIIRRDWLG
ncbi:PLP-dependent aminotransferase family protein [Tropicibacter sp. R15_0]|uniref:aminotransferase-like domain-containing protein n=1 Tax=Tropicibacter sp. R15_0 TaxID=2821101 RepID=UPI001ADC952F|nr:PLP-dependent aminotransferase family protein [Tropicibacter sp. R15_0]MBO9467090.1 PLP-dependent aminotransferase family protein [Tropicibacter sp. R15_0]